MNRWIWITIGIALGGFLAKTAIQSSGYSHLSKGAPEQVPGASTSPLQTALSVIKNSAEQGAKALDQVTALQGLLAAQNDNDPAYDTEMRNISDESKTAMQNVYRSMAREKRSERGTIVFLLGREIKSESDLKFMEEVLNESPCLSLSNCDQDAGGSAHTDGASGTETTLIYPQIMAIRSIGNFLKHQLEGEASLQSIARSLLQSVSQTHRSERVKNEANLILSQLSN